MKKWTDRQRLDRQNIQNYSRKHLAYVHMMSKVKSWIYIALYYKPFLSTALRYGPCVTQFYLPPTHEPYLSLLPSCKASPPFGWYSLHLPTMGWPGWVDLGGWSHTEINVPHRELNLDMVTYATYLRACIRLLRCTFKTCACQSQPLPVAVTCVQLLAVTYKFWQPKLLLSGLAASLRVSPNSGTVYHCHSAIRHWHLGNSAAGWKLNCLV